MQCLKEAHITHTLHSLFSVLGTFNAHFRGRKSSCAQSLEMHHRRLAWGLVRHLTNLSMRIFSMSRAMSLVSGRIRMALQKSK